MNSLRNALHLIGRDSRRRWVLLVFVALVSSGFEVVGAALVYLLLALIAEPDGAADLPLVGDVRELFDVEPNTLLIALAALMAVFFLLRAVLHVGEIYLQNRVGQNAGAEVATRIVQGYLLMPYAFHLHRSSSDLIRNAHSAVKKLVNQIFIPIIRVAAETILVSGMLVFLVVVAPVATAAAVVVIGGAAVLMLVLVQPRLKRVGVLAHHMERDTLGTLQQSLHGVRDIKILGRERAFAQIYGRARRELARASYLHQTATELPKAVMEVALLGFILAVFMFAVVFQGGAEGTLSVLGLFAYAGLRIQPSLQKIIAGLNNLKFSTAPLEDLHRDLLLIEGLESGDDQVEPLPFETALEAKDVGFRYDGGDRDAVHGLNLVIRPGEVIGICGPTGGGKTTLTDLLTGILEPTSGAVSVDGADLAENARAWHAALGVVPQMVFLTDDSLRSNIALGISAEEVDEQALTEAVDLAQLRRFVDSLPEGLDTRVGERGVRISGGQRQRIAIARALYRRPRVLIFDEGTSALDNTTEREMMAALERLRGTHTVILVAHRLSTVQKADRILLMKDGRCDALGTYEELIKSSPDFRALAAT